MSDANTNISGVSALLFSSTHPGFRFRVRFGSDGDYIAAFTECTLPIIEWEMQEVKEGGLNTYVHMLPGRRKKAILKLKNGVGKIDAVMNLYLAAMAEQFIPQDITIEFLSVDKQLVMKWDIANCYPLKLTGPQLKTSNNTVAIQTVDFSCGEITCTIPKLASEASGHAANPNNKELIPRSVPQSLRAINPNNRSLIPPHSPSSARAVNPSNADLIPKWVIPPDNARVQ